VLALRIKEKSMIETLRDPIITRGIFLLFPSSALAQRTIGKSGRTHGASTVSTPERNAIIRSVINIFNKNNTVIIVTILKKNLIIKSFFLKEKAFYYLK
jgi:hypothetical protein